MAEAETWILGALILGFFGYAIKIRKRYDLIAGFDKSQMANPSGFGEYIGGLAFMAAGLLLGLGALRAIFPDYRLVLRIGVAAALLGTGALMLTGARRFGQK